MRAAAYGGGDAPLAALASPAKPGKDAATVAAPTAAVAAPASASSPAAAAPSPAAVPAAPTVTAMDVLAIAGLQPPPPAVGARAGARARPPQRSVNSRMEQLAGAMESRLMSTEKTLLKMAAEAKVERGKGTQLGGEVAALKEQLEGIETEAAMLRAKLDEQRGTSSKLSDDLRFVDEGGREQAEAAEATRRDAAETIARRVAQLEEAVAEEAAQARKEAEAKLRGISQLDAELDAAMGGLEQRLAQAEAAQQAEGTALRGEATTTAAAAAEARAQDVRELRGAAQSGLQKLSDELRWLGEERVSCRAEDEAALRRKVGELRDETAKRLESLQREHTLEEGQASDGQPRPLQQLRATMGRVERLSGAVEQLCAHMATMQVDEIATLAEERLADIEARMGAAQHGRLDAMGQKAQQAQQALVARLSALEAAVRQEQQSSLKALQALLGSS